MKRFTKEDFQGEIRTAVMAEIAQVILAGGKKIGLPFYTPAVPFASFGEIATALGVETEDIGDILLHTGAEYRIANYYDLEPSKCGITLLKWPSKRSPSEPPKKDQQPRVKVLKLK